MKILVTGGAGFIGSHLVDALISSGDSVVVIDDFNDFYDPALKRENVAPHRGNPAYKLYETDIRDAGALKRIFAAERPEVVCHLAARAGVRPSIEEPVLYEEVNSLGTLNLLEASRGIELKNFVFAGSSSVYGINSKTPFSEDDPISKPISPYAATKRASELMGYSYSHLFGIPFTSLRFFTVYGERGRPEMAIAAFTRAIHEGSTMKVFGDGSAERDFTYIGDIVEGILAAIDNPFEYEIINIGGSRVVKLSYIIELIEGALGKKAKINYLDAAPGDVPITYADASKIERLLGFKPGVTIEEGIERYVKWFLERAALNKGVDA